MSGRPLSAAEKIRRGTRMIEEGLRELEAAKDEPAAAPLAKVDDEDERAQVRALLRKRGIAV